MQAIRSRRKRKKEKRKKGKLRGEKSLEKKEGEKKLTAVCCLLVFLFLLKKARLKIS